MRELTKLSSSILFLLLIILFVAGGTFEDLFYLIGLFLSIYWVTSVGKFGTLILEMEKNKFFIIFNILNRLVFLSLFAYFYFTKFNPLNLIETDRNILLIIIVCIFYLSLVIVTVYTSFIYEKLINNDFSLLRIITTSILFWLFPIGVWILQPKINKYVGEYLE